MLHLPPPHPLPLQCTHTDTQTQHTHTHTRAHTLSLSLSLSHTHTQSPTQRPLSTHQCVLVDQRVHVRSRRTGFSLSLSLSLSLDRSLARSLPNLQFISQLKHHWMRMFQKHFHTSRWRGWLGREGEREGRVKQREIY